MRGAELDALLTRQRDYFARRREAVEWTVYEHDQPPELAERLLAAGFRRMTPDAVMIGVVAELPAEAPAPDGVSFR